MLPCFKWSNKKGEEKKKRFKKTTTKKGCVMLTITLAATIFTHGKTKRLLLKVRRQDEY